MSAIIKRLLIPITYITLLLSSPYSFGIEDVRLSAGSASLPLGLYLELIEDRNGSYQSEDIVAGRYDYQWVKNTSEIPNFGYTASTFWYRLSIINDTNEVQSRIIQIAYPLLDHIEYYQVTGSMTVKSLVTGDRTIFDTREIPHRNFLFDLVLEPNEKTFIYLRILTEGAHQLPLSLWQERDLYTVDQGELITKSLYYGMLLVMILFNVFIYVSLKETSYLYYVGFVTSFLYMQLSMHGIDYQYFWPNHPSIHDKGILLFVPFTMLFACLFTNEFLSLKTNSPLLYRFLNLNIAANICSIIGAFFISYSLSTKISVGLVIPQSLVILLAGPLLWYSGEKTARFFTLAWFVMVLGTTMAAMNKFGLLPRNVLTENGLLFGSALEVVLLSFALADRFNREREQRFKAQKEKFEESRQRQAIEERMMLQATHNQLTLLPNRVLFQKRLAEILAEENDGQFHLAITLIHLKRFHEINKTLGHQNADELLKIISMRLREQASQVHGAVDIENKEGIQSPVATVEGVTFAMILKTHTHQITEEAIESLTKQMLEPIEFKGMSLDVGVSVGVSFFPEHGGNVATLLRHAHIAVDMADKNDNQVAIYAKEMNPYSARRLTLMGELTRAIELNNLELYFQPQINLQTNKLSGMEALIRWQHPTHGFIPPDEFIPLAEQTGIIKSLTAWVLNEALTFGAALNAQGHKITISVNISAMNLREKNFVESVENLLSEHQIAPNQLVLEVTETAMMDDAVKAMKALLALNDIGVRLSIDDFGTGHSSLAYIKKLPVHEIKIDRSFVMEMDKNLDDEMIVKTTLKMCHSLGYEVVAEGVESLIICNKLRDLGCDIVQGYYLSRPIPKGDFIKWANARDDDSKNVETA